MTYLRLMCTVAFLFMLVCYPQGAIGQCNPTQIPPNCDDCKDWRELYLTVCHGGISYNATVEVCTQYAQPPNLIDNPCTVGPNQCARAADAITWVRSFCVDQDLKNISEQAVLQAIVKGTNLCCPNGNFLGVTIPNCDAGTTCVTSTTAYCHILAMPRCMNKNYFTGCYDQCLECKDYCMIERRYCMSSPTTCCMHSFTTCSYNPDEEQCNALCNKQWDCGADYFKGSNDDCCD
jgi:hypothetical protein